MSEPLVIVSSDTHVGPRLKEDLRTYCPRQYLDDYDAFAAEHVQPLGSFGRAPGTGFSLKGVAPKQASAAQMRNLQTGGHHDVHARLRDMDRDGVAAEVIFHGSQNGQPFPFRPHLLAGAGKGTLPAEDQTVARVGNDIYNRWLADFVSTQPHRHIGLAQLSMWDVDQSPCDAETAADMGLRGVNLPAQREGMVPYNDPSWDRFWATCTERSLVLANHGGQVTPAVSAPGAYQIASMDLMALSRVSLISQLVFGGVFERHPSLKLVITERPGSWLTNVVEEMDSLVHAGSISSPLDHLRRLPSEYVRTNVFVGASFHAHFEAVAAVRDGFDTNVCWGSDYPHTEGTFQYPTDAEAEPVTHLALRGTYAGLDHDAIRNMVGENAMRVYGLDRALLTATARAIGAPTIETIDRPLETIPERGGALVGGSLAFRQTGVWA